MDLLTDEYKWAAGSNNVGGLALISGTTPMGDEPFNFGEIPLALPFYNPGIAKIRGTGRVGRAGFASTKVGFGYWTLPQYEYLQTTFGGALLVFSGFCTLRTRVGNRGFANYNAVMNIPTPDQLTYIAEGQKYEAPFLTFTHMRLIT